MISSGTGKEKSGNFVFKGKTKNRPGHKPQHSSQVVLRISDRALLKLTPTIASYIEFCSFSDLRNILDFSKTSLEVTISIDPMLTDTQVKQICLSATNSKKGCVSTYSWQHVSVE